MTCIVEHFDLIELTDRCTRALEQHVVAVLQPGHVDQSFRCAVDLLWRASELFAKANTQFRRQTRTTVLDDPERRDVELFRDVAVQPGRDEWNGRGDDGDALARNGPEDLARVGVSRNDERAAVVKRAEQSR